MPWNFYKCTQTGTNIQTQKFIGTLAPFENRKSSIQVDRTPVVGRMWIVDGVLC